MQYNKNIIHIAVNVSYRKDNTNLQFLAKKKKKKKFVSLQSAT